MDVQPQLLTIDGKQYVLLEKAEYDRLRALEESEPMLPERDAKGNYPAAEALQVGLARSILCRRRAAGLTQADLAKPAGIRPETLNRIEQGKHAPVIATVDKIERALAEAE
jgi:DNA-binding XRE family transcriptional regulator